MAKAKPEKEKTIKYVTQLRLRVKGLDVDTGRLLSELVDMCRRGHNAAVEDWLLRQRGKPESPQQAALSRRKSKSNPTGKPKPKSNQAKLYQAILPVSPELNPYIASRISRNIDSHLNTLVDWRRRGEVVEGADEKPRQERKRDSILRYGDRPPWTTAEVIPLPATCVSLEFDSRLFLVIRNPIKKYGDLRLELSLRRLSKAQKRVLRQMASGERKIPDGILRFVDIGKKGWFWKVGFVHEVLPLDNGVEITVWPILGSPTDKRQQDRFFRLDVTRKRKWYVGDGRYLLAQMLRYTGLRKMIGWRYRRRRGPGHGRKKVDKAIADRRRQERNIVDDVRRRAIDDIINECLRANAGKLVFRVPSLPLRKQTWFAKNGLEWNWGDFIRDLANACGGRRIIVVKNLLKWDEAETLGLVTKEDRKAASEVEEEDDTIEGWDDEDEEDDDGEEEETAA